MYYVSSNSITSGTSTDSLAALPPRSAEDDPLREGTRLGLAMGISTWIWIALVDWIAGQPLYAFALLGGIGVFTVLHFALNIIYGVVIATAIHGAARAPSLIIGLVFAFVVLEIAFAMLTVLLANIGLGDLAWIRIFGGSLVGAAIALAMLSRKHRLLARLREAENET